MSLSKIMIIVIIMSDCVIKVCSNRDMKVCLVTEIQGMQYIYVQGSMIRIWILTFVDSVFNNNFFPIDFSPILYCLLFDKFLSSNFDVSTATGRLYKRM